MRLWRGVRRAALIGAALGGMATGADAQDVEAVQARGRMALDGRLDEDAWRRARPATGFVQREPEQGAPAVDATEVRFAYDDDALWIGARMASDAADAIRALVTRRDREGSSEQLVVSLDTHGDRRTAYTFAVTPSGVRIDYYHGSDFEDDRDYDWDPVWDVETVIDGGGWTAELRIPLGQLRFGAAGEGSWGVNLVRRVPARNAVSYWVLVRRNETGWASRMGRLTGLERLRPARSVELLPYVAGALDVREVADPANPFAKDRSASLRLGADAKVGVASTLTLDVTANPDFGQVEADPAEVNLTAYETFFRERRPFFTENARLFGGRGLFYSRRIGAPPPGRPDADYVERVESSTILGAAKLTGRLPSGLSVGSLAAITGRETARTFDAGTGELGREEVAPLTAYGVASVQQEFGADASTAGVMLTGVRRDLDPASALARSVTEEAYGGIADSRIRWAGGKYDVSAYLGFTHVRGSSPAILALQRSSSRYWQRPDAGHVALDPGRTSLTGTLLGVNHSKMAGEHWLWDADYYQQSPGLEPNDIGALADADNRGLRANFRYRDTEPGRLLRSWVVGTEQVTEWTFGGERQFTAVFPYARAVLGNFWRVDWTGEIVLGGLSDALTRGGPLMARPSSRRFSVGLENDRAARNRWELELAGGRDDAGGWYARVEPRLSLRPGTRWELSVEPRWARWEEPRQFVLSRDGGPEATFGRRYVFAHVDRSEVAARLRLNYTFTPDFTLEGYLEPFAASGTFHSFGELERARSHELRRYGEDGTEIAEREDGSRSVTADGDAFVLPSTGFNVRSLRSNLVLRWRWRPGSTAYLVWQQDGRVERDPAAVGPVDVLDAFGARADHFLTVKVSFWIPAG